MPFGVSDPDTPSDKLVVTAFTPNEFVLESTNITVTGVGANRTISLVPTGFGRAVITVSVTDGVAEARTSFEFDVSPSYHAPTFGPIPDKVTDEDTPLTFSLSASEFDAEFCPGFRPVWFAASDNEVLLPNSNMTVIATSATNAVAILRPSLNQSGQARVSISVSDGSSVIRQSFYLTVKAVNDPPAISPIADQLDFTPCVPREISFVVSDVDTPVENLKVTAFSSDTNLLANTNLTITGLGTNRTLSLVPTNYGTTVITVLASDGLAETRTSFTFDVMGLPGPPTVNMIPDQITDEDTPLVLSVVTSGFAREFCPDFQLLFFAESDNESLLSGSNITFTVTGNSSMALLKPSPNQSGHAKIAIDASDGQAVTRQSFYLTVNPVNDPPVISPIPDKVFPGCSPVTATAPFAVSDLDNPVEDLIVTAVSSNTNLLANTNIVLSGTGANRLLSFSTTSAATGTTKVIVTVSDGLDSTDTSFNLTVASYLPPTFVFPIADQTLEENVASTVKVRASDPNCNVRFTFYATSDQPDLFPTSSLIMIQTASAEAALILAPATNRIGRAKITVSVSDGAFVTRQSFFATVNPFARAEPPLLSGTNLILSFTASATADLILQSSSDLRLWTPVTTNRVARLLHYSTPLINSEPETFFRVKLENAQ
ncbi:MAG TPA: hypothetical protein VGR78_00915 [Verrucomicrobiae bacterium]|nr:hypothetical protein [Verrucomicrobiae bacterium]